MTPTNKLLLGVLALQGALVALAWWPREPEKLEARDLLGFPVEQITSATIWGRMAPDEVPEPPVVLTRTAQGWALDSSDGYPATDANVAPLLDLLGRLKGTEVLATKTENYPALEVADDQFTRKVELKTQDGASRTLLIGAGSGKEVNARVAGESEAWRVRGLSAWSIADQDNRYFERDFLKVDPETVQSMTLARPGQPDLGFARSEDGTWTLATGAPPDLQQDPTRVRDYVATVLTVRMLEPAGREIRPEHGLDAGAVVSWVGIDGVPSSYRVGAPVPGETGRQYLKSDHDPYVVKMLQNNVEHLLNPDPGDWRAGAPKAGLLGDPHGGAPGPRGRPPH